MKNIVGLLLIVIVMTTALSIAKAQCPSDDTVFCSVYKSAQQGVTSAQYNLGFAYDHGEGIAEDKREAVYWYRKAAEQGNTDAQNTLNVMYDNGEGVTEDKREAVTESPIDSVSTSPDYNTNDLLSFMNISVFFEKDISELDGKFYMVPEGEDLDENLRKYAYVHLPVSGDGFYQGAHSNYLYYCDEVEIRNKKEVFIPYGNYFSTYDHHLKFGTQYELIFAGTVNFSDGSSVTYTKNEPVATFQTERINKKLKSKTTFTPADVPNLGFHKEYPQSPDSTRYKYAIYGKEEIHNYMPVSDDSLTGDGINVAIVDLQIFENSLVNKAVVYRSDPIRDEYFIEKNQLDLFYTDKESILPLFNHGTQMARYMLNYASGINIYSLNKNGKRQYLVDFPSTITDNNMDIASFSGSDDSIERLGEAIHDGLIVSRSLGNNDWELNIPGNYLHKDRFLPYYSESLKGDKRNTMTGAYVTLQAVLFDATYDPDPVDVHNSIITRQLTLGTEYTFRSPAGSARYYTLAIVENGSGATSEAAATFSGMVALMLEANRKYNAGYTPRQVVEIIFQTALDIGDPGVDNLYGWGMPNLGAALEVIKKKGPVTFQLYSNLPDLDPVITLRGDLQSVMTVGDPYTELGATAWDDRDGDLTANVTSVITDSNGATVTRIDTSTPGVYTVTYSVSDTSGNSPIPVIRTVKVVMTLSVRDGVVIPDITIVPNPARNNIRVNNLYEDANYILSDIRGKILKKGTLIPSREGTSIDISDLSKGMYLLYIKTSKEHFTKKVMKK